MIGGQNRCEYDVFGLVAGVDRLHNSPNTDRKIGCLAINIALTLKRTSEIVSLMTNTQRGHADDADSNPTGPGDATLLKNWYQRDGYISGVRILDAESAAIHREALQAAETKVGKLHYRPKVHTILRSPFALSTLPVVLDVVEQLIGPDILLYNATYIVKEAGSPSKVSWHQDLTYWGFNDDAQVSMWLALSPADATSGCMRMLPGSHLQGVKRHVTTEDDTNVLFQGQTVPGVNEADAVMCPLQPGEASFHHGWTLHASMPNQSDDRRIGLNVQYLAPHMRQTKHDADSALLVRGEDKFHHFENDIPATVDLDPAALARLLELEKRYVEIAATPDRSQAAHI